MTEFQTRNQNGELVFHSTMENALNYAEKHKDIWKISYTTPDTKERIRLVKMENGWVLETVFGERYTD